MFGMSVWAWNAIPNDQMMAVHWNVFGQPDGYAPKTVALLILPTIMALVCPAVWWRLAKEQHAENLQKSMPVMNASMIGAFLVILEAHAVIILSAMGYQLPLTQMVLGSIGLLFVVIGGLMAAGKTARNTSVGIRTPWTLKDDVVWSKTNKVGGVIMAFAGLVTIGGALTNPIAGVVGIIGLVVVLPLTTLGLSYHWSKKSAGS